MTIGQRIKKRRIELQLTQEELAQRLGNKSRASVCTVENDKEDLTTTRIKQYAEALECSPAYLMGWEDELTQETFDKSYAKSQQTSRIKYYFDMFAKLPKESQDEVINFIDYQVKKNEPKED